MLQDKESLVKRSWGYFLQFTLNERSTVKLLYLEKGKSTSLQYHELRSEDWYVISGRLEAKIGIKSQILLPTNIIKIGIKQKHKLEALEDSIILEISKGIFDENDIVRL